MAWWLLLTIACSMCGAAKSEANPEVSMDVVSPFFSCLVVQVTCAVMICARPTGSVCLHRALTPGFYQRFLPVLAYTEIYGRRLLGVGDSFQISRFGQDSPLRLCCPALDCDTQSDSSSPDLLRDLPKILAEVTASPRRWWKGHWQVLSPPSPWSRHQH